MGAKNQCRNLVPAAPARDLNSLVSAIRQFLQFVSFYRAKSDGITHFKTLRAYMISHNPVHQILIYEHPMSYRFLALAAIVCSVFHAAAKAQEADSDFQFWNAGVLTGPVNADSRLLLWFDGHARFRDDAGDLGVSIIRPGIGYRLTDRLNLWLGYARVTSHLEGPNVGEDRIWQQATFPVARFLGGTLSARTRIEQRFRNTGSDTGHRYRQFLRWSHRFDGRDISLVLWDEVFVGLNDTDWGQTDGFDQNRFFIGPAFHIADKVRFEIGYLNNHVGRGPLESQTNHNLSVALFIGL